MAVALMEAALSKIRSNIKLLYKKNSSRGERAIGVANEKFFINILTDNREDFNLIFAIGPFV